MLKNIKLLHRAAALPDFAPEITALVRSNLAPGKMQEKLSAYHERDIAQALRALSREECPRLFRILPISTLCDILCCAEDVAPYFSFLTLCQKIQALSTMESACGALDLKDLIIAREGTPLSEITMASSPYVYAHMPIDECIPFLSGCGEASVPVLSDDNRLIGVVTSQDYAELLDDELGDDYAKLAGLASEEDLCEPVSVSVKKRLPWLCILLLLGLGVSATVGLFERIVAQLPVIICFQSLILDMAENVGTQSLAVAIRVLMDTQLRRRQKIALVWKETRVGLVNGCLPGTLSFAATGVYLFLAGNAAGFAFAVSACLGAAMLLAMMISSLRYTDSPLFPALWYRPRGYLRPADYHRQRSGCRCDLLWPCLAVSPSAVKKAPLLSEQERHFSFIGKSDRLHSALPQGACAAYLRKDSNRPSRRPGARRSAQVLPAPA